MAYFCQNCDSNITKDVIDYITNPGTYECDNCGQRFIVHIEVEMVE